MKIIFPDKVIIEGTYEEIIKVLKKIGIIKQGFKF